MFTDLINVSHLELAQIGVRSPDFISANDRNLILASRAPVNLSFLEALFQSGFEPEMALLEKLGLGAKSALDPWVESLSGGSSSPRPYMRAHILGAGAVAKTVADSLSAANVFEDSEAIVRTTLLHEATERIEVTFREHSGRPADEDDLSRALSLLGLEDSERKSVMAARAMNLTSFMLSNLTRDDEYGLLALRPGNILQKVVMLSDYLSASSSPLEAQEWCRWVTPFEKPSIAQWLKYFPDLSENFVCYAPDGNIRICDDIEAKLDHNEEVLGSYLAIQVLVGNLIVKELSNLTGRQLVGQKIEDSLDLVQAIYNHFDITTPNSATY